MSKQYETTYLGVKGWGKDKATIRNDIRNRIKWVVADGTYPRLLAWRGALAFVWRTPEGWSYSQHEAKDFTVSDGDNQSTTLYGTLLNTTEWYTARDRVYFRLAKMAFTVGWTDEEALPPLMALGSEDLRTQLTGWFEFNRRYTRAIDRGLNDREAAFAREAAPAVDVNRFANIGVE